MNRGKITVVKIQDIVDFFNKVPAGDGPVRLNACTVIDNPQKFVESHIQTLLKNPGKPTFKAYYDRLLRFYKIRKEKWEEQNK